MEAFLFAILAGFSALFLLVTKDYGATAALFPRVVASVSLVFIALDILWNYFRAGKRRAESKGKTFAQLSNNGWTLPLALQASYIGLIYIAGFALATIIYLIACPWQLRYRNWIVMLLHAVALTFAIVYTFHFVFLVRLPKGLLGIPW